MKKVFFLLLCFLLYVNNSFAAITVLDTFTGTEKTGGNSSAVTESVTLNASATYLEVCVSANFLFDVTAVTWNGVSMTQDAETASGSYPVASLWHLNNPATGTHNIAVSTDINTDFMVISAISLSGTANTQDTPFTGTNLSNSLTTSVDGSIVIDCAATPAHNSSFSETGDATNVVTSLVGAAGSAYMSYGIDAVAGTFNMNFTYSGTSVMPHVGVSINPSVGGGGGGGSKKAIVVVQ